MEQAEKFNQMVNLQKSFKLRAEWLWKIYPVVVPCLTQNDKIKCEIRLVNRIKG